MRRLEIIGRGAGFKGAAPEHVGSGVLHPLRHVDDLRFVLHGAGTGDDAEFCADPRLPHFYHRVLRMELAAAFFIGFADPLNRFHDIQAFQQFRVDAAGITHQPQDRIGLSLGNMHVRDHGFQPFDQMFPLFRGGIGFQYGDHNAFSLLRFG